jgi:DNA-binding NarL/FixJ family response regulator
MLVDDHTVLRTGLRMMINNHPGMTVVAEAASRDSALAALVSMQPDIVLLDLDLGNEDDGLRLLPELLAADSNVRVLLLTGLRDAEVHRQAVLRGAMGLLLKEQATEIIFKAIEKVYAGEVWLERTMIASVLNERVVSSPIELTPEAARIALLTDRERSVVALIGQGLRNKHIAEHLSISEATVRHHLTSIFSKLGMTDRFELAIFAYRHGLADVPK